MTYGGQCFCGPELRDDLGEASGCDYECTQEPGVSLSGDVYRLDVLLTLIRWPVEV